MVLACVGSDRAAIRLVCVGRLRERHCVEAAGEYLRRLARYVRVETVEVRECTDRNPEVARRRESAAILDKTGVGEYIVALDVQGRQYTSTEFSELLRKPKLTFIVGGPDGLHGDVLEEADLILSLSKMTFPHQLARVLLLEQIYRGYMILGGGKYPR